MGAKDQGADSTTTTGRWAVIPRTLCLVTHGSDVLLLKRAAHKQVFPNKYNGVGGHIERNESPLHGAVREIREETGLEVKNVRFRGVINIDAGANNGILLFVYTATALSREFINSHEGTLEWVPLAQVHDKDLVEDLPIILPKLFGQEQPTEPFSAHVSYDANDQIVFRED